MAKKYDVCYADELQPGDRKIVEIAGRSIGIFNVDSEFFALRNSCPHKAAPLCKGIVDGLVTGQKPGEFEFERTGEILRCPWHGWEFDLKTGESVFNPHKVRVRNYQVSVEAGAEVRAMALADDKDPSIETFAVTVEPSATGERPRLFVHV